MADEPDPRITTTYSIVNIWSGLYLDVNGDSAWPGASIDTWYYNGGANQAFEGV
jgi:hypothetical protein